MSEEQIRQTDVYQRILACCTTAPDVDREQHALTIAREVLRRTTDATGTLSPS